MIERTDVFGAVEQEIEAYALDVPVVKEAYLPAAISKLKNLGSQNFYIEVRNWAEPVAARKFTHHESYPTGCKGGAPPPPISYAEMVFAKGTASCAATCDGDNCPNVFLIDTRVNNHPKLARAMRSASASPAAAPADCQFLDWKENYHGTHLAGIIAANSDGNYGPTGLSPGVKLWSVELQPGTEDSQIADNVQQWMRDRAKYAGPAKILAFASEYLTDGSPRGAQFSKEIDRFSASIAAKRISKSDVLLVTAVGQETKGNVPHPRQPINTTSKVFPMNLGDLDNVIVVTACVDCETERAAIMSDANYSQPGLRVPLVHLAAPGGIPIAGIVTTDAKEIALASGTSQASAFVAGAAAAVATCFPQYLHTPGDIKKHLMVTSRPSLSADAHALVATGILDYERALRHPQRDWMQEIGTDELKQIAIDGWCTSQVELLSSNGDPPTRIDTSVIRRMFRTTNESGSTRWVIYAEDLNNVPYGLVKYGPGDLRSTGPLARVAEAGQLVSLSRFSDLLIAQKMLGTVDCREKRPIIVAADKP